ncbi:MAG: ASCH domain-containing protein [Ruminococcaceae bacterium]|nr:ASCH domain-containing protein [Oscillospiraceae bacterium]
MEYYVTTLVAAAFGTLGFGMQFKIKPSALAVCTAGGMLSWSIVLISDYLDCGIFTSNLLASIFAIIFSSCVAIKLKLPSTVLLTPCIVPLVPGGSLYYTMESLIWKDYDKFYEYGTSALLTAVGIAGGIVIGSILFSAARKPFPRVTNFNRIISKVQNENMKNKSKSKIHYMNLNKEPYDMIESGRKKVELRLYDEKRQQIKINDIIEFKCIDSEDKKIVVLVSDIKIYPTFKELYENFSMEDIGYSDDEIDNAKPEDMEEYYPIEKQKEYSVVAISFEKL